MRLTAVVLDVIAAWAVLLPFMRFGGYFLMQWQNQYPTGLVPYPMGDKARDPRANREAVERDLAAGQRQVRFWWRLWPLFAAMLAFGIVLAIYLAVA